MNCVMFAQVDDPEPWEENSTLHDGHPLAQNIRDQFARLKRDDLSISPMFLEVQYDRSRDDAIGEKPMLKMIDKKNEGIIVRGWKAIGTAMAFANELLIGNLWRPGQTPEQTIYALVPVASPGLTIFCRPSNAEPDADPFGRPLASIGDELDGMAYFDDVFIPWERIQHLGKPALAYQYLMRLGRARTATVTTENFARVPFLLRGTDLVSLVLERGVTVFDSSPRVCLLDPPFELPLLTEAMYWNPRVDADPAHRWLRQQVADAATHLDSKQPPT